MIIVKELMKKLQSMPQDAKVDFYCEPEDLFLTEADVFYRIDAGSGNAVEIDLS